MTDIKSIVERLSLFNNRTFTKKQWDIVLKGCGCPKSSHFWTALRNNNLIKDLNFYVLVNLNEESFNIVWEQYCNANKACVQKSYNKAKARKRAEERSKQTKGLLFYMVDGVLTTEKPERDI